MVKYELFLIYMQDLELLLGTTENTVHLKMVPLFGPDKYRIPKLVVSTIPS